MADTHILQHVTAFALALWWTKSWLMDTIIARWRFAISGLAGSILWLFVAFSATRVAAPAGDGTQLLFGSTALAYFSAFMAFVSVAGTILGLFLWIEEEGKAAAEELPDAVQTKWGPGD